MHINKTVLELYPRFEGMDKYFKESEDSFAAFCHSMMSGGVAMTIRNEYGFWEEESTPLKDQLNSLGLSHADEKSDYLLRLIYRKYHAELQNNKG